MMAAPQNGEKVPPAPDGYEWVEVGAVARFDLTQPLVAMVPFVTGDGQFLWANRPDTGGSRCFSRGRDPLDVNDRGGWERLYVLRAVGSPPGRSGGRP